MTCCLLTRKQTNSIRSDCTSGRTTLKRKCRVNVVEPLSISFNTQILSRCPKVTNLGDHLHFQLITEPNLMTKRLPMYLSALLYFSSKFGYKCLCLNIQLFHLAYDPQKISITTGLGFFPNQHQFTKNHHDLFRPLPHSFP